MAQQADGQNEQTTPRRCYAKFLQQLLTARIMGTVSGTSSNGTNLTMNVSVGVKASEPSTPNLSMSLSPSDSSTTAMRQTPEPISALAAHCVAHDHSHSHVHVHHQGDVKGMDFTTAHLHGNADLAFGSWDMQVEQPELSASGPLMGFSETEYMQAFMAFPEQTWFMQ